MLGREAVEAVVRDALLFYDEQADGRKDMRAAVRLALRQYRLSNEDFLYLLHEAMTVLARRAGVKAAAAARRRCQMELPLSHR